MTDENEPRYRNPPKYHGIEPVPGIEGDADRERGPFVEHLHCTGCGDRVGVARFDGQTKLVCHCTHADGEVEPVDLEERGFRLPERWKWVAGGGSDA